MCSINVLKLLQRLNVIRVLVWVVFESELRSMGGEKGGLAIDELSN